MRLHLLVPGSRSGAQRDLFRGHGLIIVRRCRVNCSISEPITFLRRVRAGDVWIFRHHWWISTVLRRVAPIGCELLCLPGDDVAEAVPNVPTEFGIGWSSSLGRPFGGCLDWHAVSVSQLSTTDPRVLRVFIHCGVFP